MNYDQLLFSEKRLVAYMPGDIALSDERLVQTMTVNKELNELGLTLSPADIERLAASEDMIGFYAKVKELTGNVDAKPMYPDFPSQVMEMDEAHYRFHQMLHYLSTYGVEFFTGQPVSKGWLPEGEGTKKEKPDLKLLACKVIGLIPHEEKFIKPYREILSRAARMSEKDSQIICACAEHLSLDELCSVNVAFKQNLLDVFLAVFMSGTLTGAEKLEGLKRLCQHTGDVWKCMDYVLTKNDFHFRTAQKKLLVKLLESYSVEDMRTNLILSNKKAERTLLMLKYLDYNEYSRSQGHKDAVRALRNGELRSWESRAKYLLGEKSPETLEYYSQRPGIMLRSIAFLLRNGYSEEDILSHLLPKADTLSARTLVSLITHFAVEPDADISDVQDRRNESNKLHMICEKLLGACLVKKNTPLRGKSVYLMPGDDMDLEHSVIEAKDSSEEGGYIRSGMAFRIPENVKYIRFFVYWNDKERVDVDLHSAAYLQDGGLINVGWNSEFKSIYGIATSGDITHSDAAEYIDIDIQPGSKLDYVSANLNVYSGKPTFGDIDECFVGCMAVNKIDADVKLYSPENCFFVHYLTGKTKMLNYGYIDVKNRFLTFIGKESLGVYELKEYTGWKSFSAMDYLEVLFKAQDVTLTDDPDKAELVIVAGKPTTEKQISLVDNGFFLD